MPRKNRIIAPGFYHIYNRANNRRSINLADETFSFFEELLLRIKCKFNIEVYAYCLMTNHYHILIRCHDENLDKAMALFGREYANYINFHTNGSGPVFTTRYKSKYILNDAYLLQVLKYIHLNPLSANLCQHLLDYRWSSYPIYLATQKHPLIDHQFFLDRFISVDDFCHFHTIGNSKKITDFYNNKRSPQILK